jgi:hypothetical protein
MATIAELVAMRSTIGQPGAAELDGGVSCQIEGVIR